MLRRVVPPAIIAAVAAGAVCFIMLRDRSVSASPPEVASVDPAQLAELQSQLARLQRQVAASQRIDAPPEPSAVQNAAEERRNLDELVADEAVEEADQEADVIDQSAEHEAAVQRTARRFGMLGDRVAEEERDAAWATSRESEIAALTTQHDYFKTTRFETVECRTTLCRVVASFPNEQDQSVFAQSFPGFVGQLPYAAMREVPDSNPPRVEVFLSANGPLPRE